MVKITLFFFITLILLGCNIKVQEPNSSQSNFYKITSSSYVGDYLTANYSIIKGDAYTASRILDKNLNNPKLLEIKFFSNLVSGNFNTAYDVAQELKSNNNNILYNLPKYILKIKNKDISGSLNVFENQELFFNLDDLNNLIKFWINEKERNKKYLSEKQYFNPSIYKLLILSYTQVI